MVKGLSNKCLHHVLKELICLYLSVDYHNPLLYNKILALSKLKVFKDDNFNVVGLVQCFYDRVEKMGKVEIRGIFSSHSVLKTLLFQGYLKLPLCGEGLIVYFSKQEKDVRLIQVENKCRQQIVTKL